MSYLLYDITFLVLFVLFVSLFLYKNKKNLKKDGILLLYRTEWGIKIIHKIGEKYRKTIHFLSYVSIFTGYLLMITAVYMFGKIIYIYVALPSVVKQIKVPPIMPLVPYLPQAFKLDFLPDFNFTYWIVILAIIAITHEFAHGIFAAKDNIKIKKTGFGFFPWFFPVFLAAFVEPDEKQMQEKTKFSQMAILSAGTFVNLLTGIVSFLIMVCFFSLVFSPAGVVFDTYSTSVIDTSSIVSISGNNLSDINELSYEDLLEYTNKTQIKTTNNEYIIDFQIISSPMNKELFENGLLGVYDNAPAIRAGVEGAISKINNQDITSLEDLSRELKKYSPGENILLETKIPGETKTYNLTLEKNPTENSSWLGVGFMDKSRGGIMGSMIDLLSSFKKPEIYYESEIGDFGDFIYNLLWWLVLIAFSVAIVNMVPVGIFDGGRFFYLTILGITKSEKIAKKSFSLVTKIFLILLLVLMFYWLVGIF
jgi:membrane-associated protease RseP (regulator of RpoE activity)